MSTTLPGRVAPPASRPLDCGPGVRHRRLRAAPRRLPVIVLLGVSAAACASPEPAQEPARWSVAPDPELQIGTADGEDAYLFESVQSAHFLSDGRILVADGGQSVLRIYGPDGELRTELGGTGEGPGEFLQIMGTWLTPEGRIAVWDAGNLRITTFGPDARRESAEAVAAGGEGGGNLEVFLGAFSDGDALLATLSYGGRRDGPEVVPDDWTLGRFGLDGEPRGEVAELRGMRRAAGHTLPFSPMPLVAVAGDTIYEADGYAAAITVRDETGRRVRTIDLPRQEISEEGVWSALEAELRRLSSGSPTAKVLLRTLEGGGVPRDSEFPQLANLLVDDRGCLWIKPYEPPDDSIWLRTKGALWPAPGGSWRVVRPDGGRVATVDMPDDVRPLDIEGDRLLGLATDELGVERVVVHQIEGRPAR